MIWFFRIIGIVAMFYFVAFFPGCKKRENMWIFVLTVFATIPLNIWFMEVTQYLKIYLDLEMWQYIPVCVTIYTIFLYIEELLFGIITRLIWKRQYVFKF